MKSFDPIAVLFIIGGLYSFVILLYRVWLGTRSLQWPTVIGEVTQSAIVVRNRRTMRLPDVRYVYIVAGSRYEGRDISALGPGLDWENSAQKTLDRYPVGATVAVFYDPDRPNRSVLEAGISKGGLLFRVVSASLGVVIGLGFQFWP